MLHPAPSLFVMLLMAAAMFANQPFATHVAAQDAPPKQYRILEPILPAPTEAPIARGTDNRFDMAAGSSKQTPARQTTANEQPAWFGTMMTFPAEPIAPTPTEKPGSASYLPPAPVEANLPLGKPLPPIVQVSRMRPTTSSPMNAPHYAPAPTNPNNPTNNPAARSLKPSLPALSISIVGETELILGQDEEYRVTVRNPASTAARDLIVQLTLPDGFMITELDREAWVDQNKRTLSWKIPSLAAERTETIVYRAKPILDQQQTQKIVIGNAQQTLAQDTIRCRVSAPSEYQIKPMQGR